MSAWFLNTQNTCDSKLKYNCLFWVLSWIAKNSVFFLFGCAKRSDLVSRYKVVHTDRSHYKRYEYLNGWYGFDTIPSELGLLTNLATLGLSGPGFQGNVPSQLGRLCNLKELVITDTWATRLPTELGELASLQRLDLSGNPKLSNLPSQVGELGNLQWMDVSQSIGVQNYDVMTRGTWHAYKKDTWRDRLDF